MSDVATTTPAAPASPAAAQPTGPKHAPASFEQFKARANAGQTPPTPQPTAALAPAQRPGSPRDELRSPAAGDAELEATGQQPAGEGLQAPADGAQQEGEPTPQEESAQPQAIDDAAALAKFREWEASDMFPDELMGKLFEVKVNGQPKYVTAAEMKQGYLRGSDWTRESKAAKAAVAAAQGETHGYKQHFDEVRDPDKFLDAYERAGYGDVLVQVARKIATRIDEERQIINAAGIAAAQRYGVQDMRDHRVQEAMQRAEARLARERQLEIENRRMAFERDNLKQQHESTAHEQAVNETKAQYEHQLNQLRPLAFKAYGIKDTPQHRQALIRHLNDYVQAHGMEDGGITRSLVMNAAQALKDELEDTQSREAGLNRPATMMPSQFAAQRQPNGKPLPPQRLGGGGGLPASGPNSAGPKPRGGMSYDQFRGTLQSRGR